MRGKIATKTSIVYIRNQQVSGYTTIFALLFFAPLSNKTFYVVRAKCVCVCVITQSKRYP